MEIKDILTFALAALSFVFGIYSFRHTRRKELSAADTDWAKAQLLDTQNFRGELRAEILGLKLELKDLNGKLDDAERKILSLESELAILKYQKMVIENEKQEFINQIQALRGRVTQLENILTENGLSFSDI